MAAGQFFAQRFGDGHDGRLAGTVGAGIGVAIFASHGGNVDDAASRTLFQMRRPFTAAIKHTIDVHIHDLLPCIDGVVGHWRHGASNASGIDHRIDGADFQSSLRGGNH